MPRFQPGMSGNPRGKLRGTKNRVTPDIRALCQRLFDAEYWERVYRQAHDGTIHPKIEALMLAYAFGEPRKEVLETGTVVHLGPMAALQEYQRAMAADTTTVETLTFDDAGNIMPPLALLAAKKSNGEEPS